MIESGNYHLENKTFIISVKYGTVPYFIYRVASISLKILVTLHNQVAQTVAYTLTLRAMNAREVTQFHLVNIAC